MSDSIDRFGGSLAFNVRQGQGRSPVLADRDGSDVFKVEARHLGGHQREAVVTEGEAGGAWRVTSDEGLHLKGTDLAPFPFGFFNAGLQGDLFHRITSRAAARGVAIDALEIDLANEYWLTGSFALGNARGHAEPTQVDVTVASGAADAEIAELVKGALAASPGVAFLSTPLASTFALYSDGRRRNVEGVANSTAPDASDPRGSQWHAARSQDSAVDCIEKLAQREAGTPALAPPGSTTRIVRKVKGKGRLLDRSGMTEIETWLELPGMSHFVFRTDESGSGRAPAGLALLSAGLAFCYLTQVARYIENLKLAVSGVRLVQYTPYALAGTGAMKGIAGPIDTHLFLDGDAQEETHASLLTMAARTCFLHATARAVLPPIVQVTHAR